MAIDFSQFSLSAPTSTPTEGDGIDFSKLTLGQPKRTVGGTLKDIAGTALNAAISVPEAAVGLADIPTLGYAGKAAESLGFKPKEAKQFIEENLTSPAQRYADSQVQSADGFIPTLQAGLENPSTIVKSVAQSIPSMLAGGAVAKGLGAAAGLAGEAAVKAAPMLAGAGEGAMMGGAQAENIRQQTEDGLLTPKQAALALGTGFVGGAIGTVGNKLGEKFGLTQLDTLAAGGEAQAAKMGMAKRIVGGGAAEGLIEEAPQSAIEKMAENEALNRDLMQGVGNAAASGMLAGGLMGAGGAVLHKPQVDPTQPPPPVVPPSVEPQPEPPMPAPAAQVPPVAPITPAPAPQTPYPSDIHQDGVTRPVRPDFTMDLAGKEVVPYQQPQAPVIKPNSPLNNALASAGISTAPESNTSFVPPPSGDTHFVDDDGVVKPIKQNSPLSNAAATAKPRTDKFGFPIREAATPEALAARDEFTQQYDQPAAQVPPVAEQPYKRAPTGPAARNLATRRQPRTGSNDDGRSWGC